MEEKMGSYIDSSLESFEPFLYKLNVAGGDFTHYSRVTSHNKK